MQEEIGRPINENDDSDPEDDDERGDKVHLDVGV